MDFQVGVVCPDVIAQEGRGDDNPTPCLVGDRQDLVAHGVLQIFFGQARRREGQQGSDAVGDRHGQLCPDAA